MSRPATDTQHAEPTLNKVRCKLKTVTKATLPLLKQVWIFVRQRSVQFYRFMRDRGIPQARKASIVLFAFLARVSRLAYEKLTPLLAALRQRAAPHWAACKTRLIALTRRCIVLIKNSLMSACSYVYKVGLAKVKQGALFLFKRIKHLPAAIRALAHKTRLNRSNKPSIPAEPASNSLRSKKQTPKPKAKAVPKVKSKVKAAAKVKAKPAAKKKATKAPNRKLKNVNK